MAAAILLGALLAAAAGAGRATAEDTAEATGDTRLGDGCWRADPSYFVQAQHGSRANGASGDGIPTGHSLVGRPDYWGDKSDGPPHAGCTDGTTTNDKYAVDYPLGRGDAVYSPFRGGVVTFAGRYPVAEDYGIFVVIEAANGRYLSLSARLNGLLAVLSRGDGVTDNTIIGFAGDSGQDAPTDGVHLHQSFYREPDFTPEGVPHGGAGLRVDRLRYAHGGGGVYRSGWERSPGVKAQGSPVGY